MKRINIGKKMVFLVAIIFVGASVIPSLSGSTGEATQGNENIRITVQNDEDVITINYQISEFTSEELTIDGDSYLRLTLDDESNIMLKGKPELPNICRSIIIPDDLKMEVMVTQSQYQEYEGLQIIPSKGHLPRTVNPEEVPYEFDGIYNENKWFPEKIAELREPYILRDFRCQVVEINPFQYNPVEEKLRFYTDITIEVYPNGIDSINCITRTELPSKIDTDFKQIYARHFINLNTIFDNRYDPVEEQGNMLVITYDNFWDSMMPFIQWKNMKGVPAEMVNVSTIGDANAIKTYIENYYNNNGLTFVLLVGDAAQVPTLYPGYSASDPSYSYIVGNDHYPDLFVGRFSAQNTGDLETQVERSIEYEKNPQSGADWYHKGIGVASNQGPGDDGEYDDEHIENIRNKLLIYTYTEIEQSYDYTGTTAIIAAAINNGLSIANYCGHGSPTSWGNGGGFSNSDVNALTNDNMLPFINSVACNNGEFDNYDACFAEAWLRATNAGEPSGAIGVYASSISQSWNPPMDAQDEFIDILVESYTDNKKITFGALCFNGAMHMNDEYGSAGEIETDAWTVFGDPSLQVRTDTPDTMTVTHNSIIPIGSTTFDVDVTGVEDALCAISHDYELLGYGYTDDTGRAVITFDEPLPYMDGADLVVTGHNKIPYTALLQIGDSYPPYPPTIDGPPSGKPGKEYEYTSVTTDPEEEQIFYMFDWGDSTFSEWLGPYNSGESVTASHAWPAVGDYEIKVRAKDIGGGAGYWSDPFPIRIDLPVLNVGVIKGGLTKVSATIKNIGLAEADEINWKITLDGGLILLGKETTGTIQTILAGGEEEVRSGLIFGFGQTRVTVTADIPEDSGVRNQGAFVLLFFISVLPGGG